MPARAREGGRAGGDVGRGARAAARRARRAIKDLFDFKPGWTRRPSAACARSRTSSPTSYCAFAERIEQAGAILIGKTNSPVMGFRGTCDNYLFGPTRNPFDPARNSGGSSGGSAAAVADGLLPFAEGTDGGGSIRIPAVLVRRLRLQGVVRAGAVLRRAQRVRRHRAVPVRGADHAHGRGRGPRAHRARRLRPARSLQPRRAGRLHRCDPARDHAAGRSPTARTSTSSRSTAGSPRWSAKAVRAFEEAGAQVEEVKVGIERPQQELSDLWCRLITPVNLHAFELFKAGGHRPAARPPRRLAAAVPATGSSAASGYSALDLLRDQALRTEIYRRDPGRARPATTCW